MRPSWGVKPAGHHSAPVRKKVLAQSEGRNYYSVSDSWTLTLLGKRSERWKRRPQR